MDAKPGKSENAKHCRSGLCWLLATVALVLVGYLAYRSRADFSAARQLAGWRACALILLYLVQFLFSTLPHFALIRHLSGRYVPVIQWFRIMVLSRFANSLAPQAGTAYKAFVLKKDYDVSYTTYIHVHVLFSWMTTVLNLGLASLFSTRFLFGDSSRERLLAVGLYAVTIGVMAAPFIGHSVFHRWKPRGRWLLTAHTAINNLLSALTEHGTHLRLMTTVVGLGLVRFALWVLFFRIALSGFGLDVSLAALALFLAVWQLSALLIITPGNLGVQEVVYGVVGSAVGIGAAHGVMLSALIRVAQYLVIFPLGLACGGLGMMKKRKTETEDGRPQTADRS